MTKRYREHSQKQAGHGKKKCATQCAVKQTQTHSTACYVAGIEDFSSRLNVIGPQVRKLRTHKGWTQNQLALKLQTLWLGHQPGIGDAAGKTSPGGCRIWNCLSSPRFWASKPTTCSRATCAARSERWPRITASKLSRGQVPPDLVKFKGKSSVNGENNCHSNTAYKIRSPSAKP